MIFKNKIILSLLIGFCFLLTKNSIAQNQSKIIRSAGFEYFSIKDKTPHSTCDSIRFIMNTGHALNKPLLLFIQGSYPEALIYTYQKNECFSILDNLIHEELLKKYNFVLISKPGISLCADYDHRDEFLNKNFQEKTYYENDYLNYYVQSARQVIRYILRKKLANPKKIFVVGHSRGYGIAAKLSALYPHLITKTVCMSAHVLFQDETYIHDARRKEMRKELTPEQAQQNIDSVYEKLHGLKYWVNRKELQKKDPKNYAFSYTNYTFNFDTSLDYLLKIKGPLLVVYGTNDPASESNDLLPYFFMKAHKSNLTIQCYPGYDHNYTKWSPDAKGKLQEEDHWADVFDKIDQWLQGDQRKSIRP